MSHRFAHITTYEKGSFDIRDKGVPQGSSLSLFLSNIAAHVLDLWLERLNGSFFRFADDVVAVAHSYTDATAIASAFRHHCNAAGLQINYKKSPGIMLLGGGPERERRTFFLDVGDGDKLDTINFIDYLGHRFTGEGVCLPRRSMARIKSRISSIIHKHLFLHRRGSSGKFSRSRVGPGFFDWDLLTCLNEIRKYIYGGLHESQISEFLDDDKPPPHVRGLMAFFPLVTDMQQLRVLDGWLVNVIERAHAERLKVLKSNFGVTLPKLSRKKLIEGTWYSYPSLPANAQLPSFVRSWRVARKYYFRYGLSNIKPPGYYSLLEY